MTCRQKLAIEHPDEVGEKFRGGCLGCPECHGYLNNPPYCDKGRDDEICARCWDREIPETDTDTTPHIKDSGERRQFYDVNGNPMAVRDIQEGKGRCDLMPLDVVGDFLSNNTLQFIGMFQESGDVQDLKCALSVFDAYEPYTMMLEVAKHFEEGAKKYGEVNGVPNWKLGIPVKCYIDSAVRHYLKWLRGDNDEPHDRAFVWNVLACWWTCIHKPELNDYAKEASNEKPV